MIIGHRALWQLERRGSFDQPQRSPEVSTDMSIAGATLRTASFPALGAGGGPVGERCRPLSGLELSLHLRGEVRGTCRRGRGRGR